MTNESQFCGSCGKAMSGPFCGSCGAPAAQGADHAAVQDAPTRMVAGDEQTSYRPQVEKHPDDVETGWYQGADAAGSEAPYDSVPYASQQPYGHGAAYGATAYSSAGYQTAPQARRSNNTPFIAAGLVSLLVLACLGGYLFMRGGDDSSKTAQNPTTLPSTASPMVSPSSSPTTQPTGAPTTQPTSTPTTQPTAIVPPAADPTTSTQTPSTNSTPAGVLPGERQTITMDGTPYILTQSGRSVGIYTLGNDEFQPLANITLPSDPDYGHNANSLELVALSGCSKPVLTFNSKETKGSGAFGWDGSTYKVYKSTGADLEPIADSLESFGTYGVYVKNGAVVYKDSLASERHYFRGCSSSSPDKLHFDGTS